MSPEDIAWCKFLDMLTGLALDSTAASADLCPADSEPCYVDSGPDSHWRCGTSQCHHEKGGTLRDGLRGFTGGKPDA